MTDVAWKMDETTIVRKIEQQPEQVTLPDPSFTKIKQGERMHFDAHVNVESLPEGMHLKKATLFSNVPGGGTWEFISDEGRAVGGRGTAPSPLMYFAVGLGLCLMSHVEMLAKKDGFTIKSARLEERVSWTTTLDLGDVEPADTYGTAEGAQLNLLIESDDDPSTVEAFVTYCRQACMALQTVTSATPATTEIHLNGTRIAVLGEQAA